jgi:hypothetical protein
VSRATAVRKGGVNKTNDLAKTGVFVSSCLRNTAVPSQKQPIFLTQIRPSNASQKNIIRRVLLFIGFFKIFDRKAFENQHSKCTFASLSADG